MSEGDLLVLRETAEFPVEWAVVAPATTEATATTAAGGPATAAAVEVGGGGGGDDRGGRDRQAGDSGERRGSDGGEGHPGDSGEGHLGGGGQAAPGGSSEGRRDEGAEGRPEAGSGAAADEPWLVVPADTNPATGSGDVRIPARAATGPLTLRCGFAVRVPIGLLAGGVVSGSLDRGFLGLAREKVGVDLVSTATRAAGSPLERETDSDPEYLDWIESTIAPAARALETAAAAWSARRPAETAAPGGGGGSAGASGRAGVSGQEALGGAPGSSAGSGAPANSARSGADSAGGAEDLAGSAAGPSGGALRFAPRRRWALSPSRLAVAALLALSLGLSWSTFSLWRQVERLSQPLFDPPSGEVLLGGPNRDPLRQPIRMKVPPGASHILLTVVLGSNLPTQTVGRLEIQTETGRALWSSPSFALKPADERSLVLSRDLVPGRRYLLVLYGQSGSGGPLTVPLERRYLELEPLT